MSTIVWVSDDARRLSFDGDVSAEGWSVDVEMSVKGASSIESEIGDRSGTLSVDGSDLRPALLDRSSTIHWGAGDIRATVHFRLGPEGMAER